LGPVPLYAARIEDLRPGDFVKVHRAACGHMALLAPAFLSWRRPPPLGDANTRPGDDHHQAETLTLAMTAFPLPAIFGLRRSDGLPLQVKGRVRSVASERDDVILDVTGTRTGRPSGRWTGVLVLKLAFDSIGAMFACRR